MYQSSVYAKEQIENELIYSVAEAYLTLQRANEVYELSKKNYESYVAWEEKSKIKFQNGLLSLKDYSKIQARSISRYMNFEEDTKRYIDGITTMQRYLDFSDKEIEYFETPNIESEYFNNVKLSLSQSKLSSPFIKEANENIKLYKSQMEQAKVNFYPTIDLIALKSKQDETFESTSETETEETSLELKASLELYSGGKEQAEYDSKLMEYRQKIQKKEAVIKDVIYKVDLALNQMNLLSIKESFFNDLINKREEENVAANYDFKFGKIDENDLLDIVDSLYNAKRQYVENKYDLMIAKYKLLEQIGVVKQSILED
jgi:adhesin transport system outer membrane protein